MTATDPVDEARLGLLLGELRLPGVKHIWPGFVTLTAALANQGWTGLYAAAISRHPANA